MPSAPRAAVQCIRSPNHLCVGEQGDGADRQGAGGRSRNASVLSIRIGNYSKSIQLAATGAGVGSDTPVSSRSMERGRRHRY